MTRGAGSLIFWSDLVTALAYYIITFQSLRFATNPKVLSVFQFVGKIERDKKERKTIYEMTGIGIVKLFALHLWLCGNTHVINALRLVYPRNSALTLTGEVFMVACAAVAFVCAVVCLPLFPTVVEMFESCERGLRGYNETEHADHYLIEAMNLMNEGIVVISDKMVVFRASDASQNIFGQKIVGSLVTSFLHPDDRVQFSETVVRVATSYNFTPAKIEVRILVIPPFTPHTARHTPESQSVSRPSARRGSHNRVHATDDSIAVDSLDTMPNYPQRRGSHRLVPRSAEKFKWIEITMCRGKQYTESEGFGYDLKMMCRDIDDQKKRQVHQRIADGNEEKSRADEIKLSYISSVAHDLKTPVQSFSYSLDLLNQTELNAEQRDYVQQANVAVDLMRLTISQTMDISKVLAGGKLMPRRATTHLSLVLNRVKIIIDGYGKQVPVSFEVAPDVCDEIITDEEWLWQMLMNLLTNACKHTTRGDIQVRISVVPETTSFAGDTGTQKYAGVTPLLMDNTAPDMLLCEVIDTGVGIDPHKLRLIFDAFAQVQEGQVTGTGLGLFGVRTRAEGLQGTCGARHNTESSTGTGTVQWFAIPYFPDAAIPTCNSRRTASFNGTIDSGAIVPSLSSVALNQSYRSTTVNDELAVFTEDIIRRLGLTAMVVEDTLTVRKLMQQLLLKMGFERVDCYENGSKGLEAMMAAPVDIVFSDVQMPIMTGPEMVSRFRKWEADTLRAAVQGNFLAAHAAAASVHVASSHTNHTSNSTHAKYGLPGSAPQSPQARALSPGVSRPFASFPMLVTPTTAAVSLLTHTNSTSSSRYLRTVRPRQLIVAVTANGAECGECGENGFDEICLKPLTKNDIYRIINRYFE